MSFIGYKLYNYMQCIGMILLTLLIFVGLVVVHIIPLTLVIHCLQCVCAASVVAPVITAVEQLTTHSITDTIAVLMLHYSIASIYSSYSYHIMVIAIQYISTIKFCS